jgi:hypothetical protein
MVASRLVTLCPDHDAKLYSATQTMDEARHVEVLAKYVKRTGPIQAFEPTLRTFIEKVLGAGSWLQLLIGMQLIVEGAALSSLHAYRKHTRDPLLLDVLDGILRDEARHVAFGTLYLRRYVDAMHQDEREEMADFVFDSVMAFAATRRNGLKSSAGALRDVGITLEAVLKEGAEWLRSGKAARGDPTQNGIVELIVPTLKRTGLLTPRIEAKFAVARIPASSTSPLLEQLDTLVQMHVDEPVG